MKITRIWSMIYQHDRRANRHKCRACWKNIESGDRVLIMRVQRRTWALHEECAEKPHSTEPQVMTWRQVFELWADNWRTA